MDSTDRNPPASAVGRFNNIAALKDRAANQGGIKLNPKKKSEVRESLAVVFRSRNDAEQIVKDAADLGFATSLKSTYSKGGRMTLVVAEQK